MKLSLLVDVESVGQRLWMVWGATSNLTQSGPSPARDWRGKGQCLTFKPPRIIQMSIKGREGQTAPSGQLDQCPMLLHLQVKLTPKLSGFSNQNEIVIS